MRIPSLRDDHPRRDDTGRAPTSPARPVHLCGTWLAISTGDQAAVLTALDLSDPVPVTMRQGESAWNRDHHSWDTDGDRRHPRMYVTPVLDGWTLVFGELPGPAPRADRSWARDVRDLCARLSARFGAAHLYGMSCGDPWTMWCLAESGSVLRYYETGTGERIGSHPAEDGYRLPDEDEGLPPEAFDGIDPADADAVMARRAELYERHALPEVCYATDIAALTSVDPGTFGARTRVSGQGVLALTALGHTRDP
ncbi:hypothetical protein [Catellatospora citrea]|uniref:Uncharacterized protein n=1 Tax=Catellatospora citrea TaxID=53366 RepID=A0A8J3KA82_9ACTN|nr:hypothetical protein [Catellatospora citrea]RKE12917.1 hypothetical protein C8E86_7862 [Catellatospora citrea]GIF95842.1 hypothetical protein Cci01nite_09360 [Catellatospora citrea]